MLVLRASPSLESESVCRAFAYDSSSTATLSEQLTEPVAALKGGLTHLGDAMSSVTAFIPGVPCYVACMFNSELLFSLLYQLDPSISLCRCSKRRRCTWKTRQSVASVKMCTEY